MGDSYFYECKKCKKITELIFVNAYFLRPSSDGEVNSQIDVSLNNDLRNFIELFPDGRIDRTRQTYTCPKCGRFKNEYDLSMYIPNESNQQLEDYLIPFKESGYVLFQKNPHICQVCNIDMNVMPKHDFDFEYKCPYCDSPLSFLSWEHFRG